VLKITKAHNSQIKYVLERDSSFHYFENVRGETFCEKFTSKSIRWKCSNALKNQWNSFRLRKTSNKNLNDIILKGEKKSFWDLVEKQHLLINNKNKTIYSLCAILA
jgi:hypothetical protein